ncbi:hypothetical protein COUCH_25120 [Couchioplanes caeruleus]|uniref:hypothetical protein n=1 Tax=Couchioplanes caeruleus TaxID=56438 RepID=UPI0020C009C4|nr:hypothetical protein [Couchioplanes caeruleus]UQU62306.1 hypothetical protein COUCH_25120 [Couchioplanes caeruleus]
MAVLLLAPLVAACTGPSHDDGLTGQAVVLDDTGRGESPIDKGWIIAVPAAVVDDLWRTTGNKPVDRQNLKGVSARVSRDQVTQAGGVVAALDDDGEFVLPAKQGPHLICYLESADIGGGEVVQGCGFLTLPASGELEITDGEPGFSVGMKE